MTQPNPENRDLETSTGPQQPTEPAGQAPRRIGRGRPRWVWVALGLTILVGASVAVMLTVEGQPDYISVEQAVTQTSEYKGQKVQVYGMVQDWNPVEGNNRFQLNDTFSTSQRYFILDVDAAGISVPSAFGEQKTATITGYVVEEGGEVKLKATEIRVGCPSKYVPEEQADSET